MIKVIFICGVNHSGTTMLDLMLSNGIPEAMSCGELYSVQERIKRDIKKEFYVKLKNAMKTGANPYKYISSNRGRNIIIDSSKVPYWIQHQNFVIEKNRREMCYHNIVIYKTPLELGHSYYKRGHKQQLVGDLYCKWNNMYLNLKNSIVIRYSDLAKTPNKTLLKICEFTKIPYFNGKENFWHGEMPYLAGGCTQVCWNFFDDDTKSFKKRLDRIIDKQNRKPKEVYELESKHRTIYYDDSWKDMPDNITNSILSYPGVQETFNKLEKRREII